MNNVTERQWERDFLEIKKLPLPWQHLKNRRIFMTGATGFIGSYFIKGLCCLNDWLSLDLELELFYRTGTEPPFSAHCVRWIKGTMTEKFIPETFHPDIIIHAASPANQQDILADPVGVVDCNVLATQYVLERARKDHSMFVFFSSGEVYQRKPGRIAEQSARSLAQSGALPFYGSNKLAGELLCERYREEYGVDCRILRPFSVFGPGEPLASGRCFTDFIRQAREARKIQVNGPGTQIRSCCYLSDFFSGLLYVLLNGESAVYNFGNEENVCSILELAQQIAGLYGNTAVIGPLSVGAQADSFVPDTTKLRQLGWRPQVHLQDCIQRCLNSYLEGE